MITAPFDYESPQTLGDALALLSREDAKLLAGGHSLLPAMKLRLAAPGVLVDLGRIPGLAYIRQANNHIAIGAMTTHAEIVSSGLLRSHSPLLPQTAAQIGDTQVRNRGTLGGSLAHADPAADHPAAILALDAEIVAISNAGERVIKAADFFQGLFATALGANEIITEVRIPPKGGGMAYKKFGHPASGFAVVGVAAVVKLKGVVVTDVAVGITGVAQTAYRATAVESALRGKPASAIADAAKRAADGVEALGDTFASAEYRKHLATVYCRRALEEAAANARKR